MVGWWVNNQADKLAPTGYLDGFVDRLHLSIIENNGE